MSKRPKDWQQIIIDEYSNTDTGEIAQKLGMSVDNVRQQASILGVKKIPELRRHYCR